MVKSHDGCGKVVHRLCSNCISSIQEEVWESVMSQVSLGHSDMMGKSHGYVT